MEYNWKALLLVCVDEKKTVKDALAGMGVITTRTIINKKKCTHNFTNSQLEQIIELKKTKTWEELQNIYGVNYNTLYRKIKDYEKDKLQFNRKG